MQLHNNCSANRQKLYTFNIFAVRVVHGCTFALRLHVEIPENGTTDVTIFLQQIPTHNAVDTGTVRNKRTSMPNYLNVCLCCYSMHTFIHIWPWPLTADLQNLFNDFHSGDEYLRQVSLEFAHPSNVLTTNVQGQRIKGEGHSVTTYQQLKSYKSGTDRLTEFSLDGKLSQNYNMWHICSRSLDRIIEIAITLLRIAWFRYHFLHYRHNS